jgi:dihydrofolate reductase
MKKSIIVAVSENGVIGKDNDLIWQLPRDLRFFMKMTTGHCMLMGSNTYLALGKPLKNRTHIVISRTKTFEHEQIKMAQTVEEGIKIAQDLGEEELFISGGGAIYEYCLNNNLVDKAYITTVHSTFEGDTFFNGFNKAKWKSITQARFEPDEMNAFAMTFEQFVKDSSPI